ncbi:MAG: polymer-forming cytoskeletal protein [Pseudomonadaceae bacterium]|nr:polymer-forming cytoskeletal protein [Pseudomonadaceae bacterium]
MMKGKSGSGGKVEKGTTLVAANTRIIGDVRFTDQLFLDGVVEGNVIADDSEKATVIVSEEGSVIGEIRAPHVVINGTVEGNVFAGARVELAAKARVKGNVHYKLIEMQLGAMVDGQLLHADDASNVLELPLSDDSANES